MDRSFRFGLLLILGVLIPLTFMMVPLYLRHKVYVSTHTAVATSDFHILDHRMSTVWCEAQHVHVNSTFNAYLMDGWPEFENSTRTYWTTKSFVLNSEDREYWGFYLPKGSVLTVGTCARFEGGHLTIIKGRKSLKKCARSQDNSISTEDSGDGGHSHKKKDGKGEEEEEEEEDEEEEKDGKEGEDEEETDNDDDDDSEDEEEESSFSSSEEDFELECRKAVVNRTLPSSKVCDDITWYPTCRVVYKVPHTDYYYLLFTSNNNIFPNKIYANFTIMKHIYNVHQALRQCVNVTDCRLPFEFGSDQHVVLEIPDRKQWKADVAHTSCEPRTALYFPFYLGVPISILFFAFRGNRQKR